MRRSWLLAVVVLGGACAQKPAEWAEVPLAPAERQRMDEAAALGTDDLWGVTRPDVYHFDGSAWTRVGSPGAEHLAVVAPNDVWGAGRGGSWFHWDGHAWSSGRVEAAAKKYLDFYGIVAWPGEAWATAGVEGYFRFDGAEWTAVFPPELDGWELERLSSIGREVWVALRKSSGEPGHRVFKVAVGHFDGAAWTVIDQPPGLRIRGSAPDDVWIVRNTPMHFDGHTWTQTTPGDGAVVYDLFARSKTEAYLVGKSGLAMRWDGQTWQALRTGTRDDLFCVIGGPAGPVWAGGARGVMLRFPK